MIFIDAIPWTDCNVNWNPVFNNTIAWRHQYIWELLCNFNLFLFHQHNFIQTRASVTFSNSPKFNLISLPNLIKMKTMCFRDSKVLIQHYIVIWFYWSCKFMRSGPYVKFVSNSNASNIVGVKFWTECKTRRSVPESGPFGNGILCNIVWCFIISPHPFPPCPCSPWETCIGGYSGRGRVA